MSSKSENVARPSNRLRRSAPSQPPSVAPRYYISSGEMESDDVLVYSNLELRGDDSEFSLMKPYHAFNEVDLQGLFPSEGGDDFGPSFENELSSPPDRSLLSQLYDDFEEFEIFKQSAFRQKQMEHGDGEVNSKSPFFFASVADEVDTAEIDEDPVTMPPWLSLNQARFAPLKLRKLQRDLASHLSTKEIEDVVAAIHSASNRDAKMVAGASDFCSILVNSLEMTDVPALCASAFHYCSLVSIRERMVDGEIPDYAECSVEETICLDAGGADARYLCALAGSGVEEFGSHAVKIALDAARLKSMEMLATSVVGKTGKIGYIDNVDAENLRSLLLSVNDMGDWRALAIRAASCLYRLEGLEAYRTMSVDVDSKRTTHTPTLEETRASQEALHIYAPLAARLGMFRLKANLEDAAFRTLYPHSHARVSALCGGEKTNNVGEGMRSVLSDTTSKMKRLLQEDCSFMEHIESVKVKARVKEPYSTWRKILKINKEGGKNLSDISILDVPDAVALRVVFSARKLTPDEPDATTKRREEALCYHVQDLCTKHWPETEDSRFKDYVSKPKENGYQSLHYSTRQRWRGFNWPFEVQIRSNDMHRIAEYGVAAHWMYKRKDMDGQKHRVKRLDKSSESYLRSVHEWHARQVPELTLPESPLYNPQYLEDEIRNERKRERNERLAPYLEALSGAQTDMARVNVYVFVSIHHEKCDEHSGESKSPDDGTVLSLPRGSRVLDAIKVAQEWSDEQTDGSSRLFTEKHYKVLRNGRPISTSATEALSNGDVVSILPSLEPLSTASSSAPGEPVGELASLIG